MQITDEATIARIKENWGECNDGLFTVAGQSTLIEMIFYGCNDGDYWCIEVGHLDENDCICNSSEVYVEPGTYFCDQFDQRKQVFMYDSATEAYAAYALLIEKHNNF